MASNSSCSFHSIYEIFCSPCKDDGLNNEAQFFCDECKKYYCNNCVQLHKKLFRTHSVLGREHVRKWMLHAGQRSIEACDKHGDKKIELLCKDHDELCCHICFSLTHRMCQNIPMVSDAAKECDKTQEFKNIQEKIRKMTTDLRDMHGHREKDQKSLHRDGKIMVNEIKAMIKKMKDLFDNLEKQTIDEIDLVLKEHDDVIQDEKSKCINHHNKLETYLNQMLFDKDGNTSYIAYKKCKYEMKGAENLLDLRFTMPDVDLALQADSRIEELLSRIQTFWKIFNEKEVFKVINPQKYNVQIQHDERQCCINGICELPGGEIIITDYNNFKVKLLNSQYQVIAAYYLSPTEQPEDICHIAGNEVAIPLCLSFTGRVNFITVAGSTLSFSRRVAFPHLCYGISHHNGNLYIGSMNEIYHYKMPHVQQGTKIYEDNTAKYTVKKFALSNDGTKIFVPASDHNKLITMDSCGNILSTLQSLDFNFPSVVCLSNSGQVFVCSQYSQKVTQVDKESKHKLATLVTVADGLQGAFSMGFLRKTHSLIVGEVKNEISVFPLQQINVHEPGE